MEACRCYQRNQGQISTGHVKSQGKGQVEKTLSNQIKDDNHEGSIECGDKQLKLF